MTKKYFVTPEHENELMLNIFISIMKGDKIYPYFITTQFPAELRGLLIAAIFAAAISSIDSSLNCVSTLTLPDFYTRYVQPEASEAKKIKMLRIYTVVWGILGTGTGLAIIRVRTALETGWQLAGIAGGGVIGLFLLRFFFSRVKPWQAGTAAVASIASILWATFARNLPPYWAFLECSWHARMIGVTGTVTLLLTGLAPGLCNVFKNPSKS